MEKLCLILAAWSVFESMSWAVHAYIRSRQFRDGSMASHIAGSAAFGALMGYHIAGLWLSHAMGVR